MRRPLTLLTLLLAVALAAGGCSRYLTAGAVVVNGVSISEDEIDAQIQAAAATLEGETIAGERRIEMAREVILQMIQEELVRQEAERHGIAVGAKEVDERLAEIRSRFPDERSFQEALTQQGFTEATLRARIREVVGREALARALAEDDPVTDAEVRQAYQRQRSRFQEYRVRQILFAADPANPDAAMTEAREARTQIEAGTDFAALARRVSDDTATKARGGDMGYKPLTDLTQEIGQAVTGLQRGEVSEPIQSALGVHLIQLVAARTRPFAQVQEEVRAELERQREQQALGEFLQKAIVEADIVVNPRYGDWDPEQFRIVPHQTFVRATPATELSDRLSPEIPPGFAPEPAPAG